MATRVGVLGYRGRMGSEACRAIEADPDLDLVARVGRGDPRDALAECSVVLDVTTPDAVRENAGFLIAAGVHTVVGTSGVSAGDLATLGEDAAARDVRLFVVPNFAVGAVLMMTFAAKAAPYFASAEIVERHHEKKLDAPSGTSLRTAALMNEARAGDWAEPAPGARGHDVEGVHIHSLRLRGSVAHQEVILGGTGETLTIRHDSLDRSSFMPGVLLAIKNVASLPAGLTVGLEHLLDL